MVNLCLNCLKDCKVRIDNNRFDIEVIQCSKIYSMDENGIENSYQSVLFKEYKEV